MNGELDYDDILHFPEEIVVEKINDFYLVIAVQTANCTGHRTKRIKRYIE